jgi:hypothetical protein
MRKPPQLDGVQSALNDLISLEKERLDKEEAERIATEEAERKRREEAERRRREEEARRIREEEEARLAKEQAEMDQVERKKRDKELEEMRLKKELEMKQRLQEERLRMDHEKEIKTIEAQKKGFPKWIIGVIVGFVVAGLVVSIVLYQMNLRAKQEEQARIAAEQKAKEEEQERKMEIAKLQQLLNSLEDKANLTEQELAAQKEMQDQLQKLQDEESTTTVKKKKKKGSSSKEGKGPSLDLGDPLSGI